MKLKFIKNEAGEVSVKIEEKDFCAKDYIKMIKEIKEGKKIEVDFEGKISKDEQDSVRLMIKKINNIKETNDNGNEEIDEETDEEIDEEIDEKINPNDIPF